MAGFRYAGELNLDNSCLDDVFVFPECLDGFGWHWIVHGDKAKGCAFVASPAEVHVGDVYLKTTQGCADKANHPRTVEIGDEQHTSL